MADLHHQREDDRVPWWRKPQGIGFVLLGVLTKDLFHDLYEWVKDLAHKLYKQVEDLVSNLIGDGS